MVDEEMEGAARLAADLGKAGFEVITANNGARGLEMAQTERPALVLTELTLPRMPGFELCRRLKRDFFTRHIPIIILTAEAAEPDRILGFELGADDYVIKPSSSREISLRIRLCLHRMNRKEVVEKKEKVILGEIVYDCGKHEVTIQNELVRLTQLEFRLLGCLMKSSGHVLDRSTLLEEVWGMNDTVISRTVDTHMRRLRIKLGPVAEQLETVRGAGYRLNARLPANQKQQAQMANNDEEIDFYFERLGDGKSHCLSNKRPHLRLRMADPELLLTADKD